MVKQRKNQAPLIAMLVVLITMVFALSRNAGNEEKLVTSDVIDMFRTHQVAEYELNLGTGLLRYKTVSDSENIVTYKVPNAYTFLDKIDPYVDEYNRLHPNRPMKYNWIMPGKFAVMGNGYSVYHTVGCNGRSVLYVLQPVQRCKGAFRRQSQNQRCRRFGKEKDISGCCRRR